MSTFSRKLVRDEIPGAEVKDHGKPATTPKLEPDIQAVLTIGLLSHIERPTDCLTFAKLLAIVRWECHNLTGQKNEKLTVADIEKKLTDTSLRLSGSNATGSFVRNIQSSTAFTMSIC